MLLLVSILMIWTERKYRSTVITKTISAYELISGKAPSGSFLIFQGNPKHSSNNNRIMQLWQSSELSSDWPRKQKAKAADAA